MNTAIAHDYGKHPLTLSHPLSNRCAESFLGILLPPNIIIYTQKLTVSSTGIPALPPARPSWVECCCTHTSAHTHTCMGTGSWSSWGPCVMNHCGFPQGMKTSVSNQVHQEQHHQACSEGSHLLTLPEFRQPTQLRHLLSLCGRAGSVLSWAQHLQQEEHTRQTPNTALT